MAARLNTKFIALAAITVALAVALVVGLALLRMRSDATKNIAEGDALMAQGEYARALNAYGRASAKEPSNLAYLDKVESALRRVVPRTVVESQERFRLYRSVLERRTGIAPRNGGVYMPYLDLLFAVARISDSPLQWKELEEVASRMVDQVDPSDPTRIDGLLFRGVGAVGRFNVLNEREVESMIGDLREVVAARPDSDLGWATLIRALALEADRERAAGRPREVLDEAMGRVEQTIAQAVAAAPGGTRVAEAELRMLLRQRDAGDERVTIDRMEITSTRVATNAATLEDPLTVSEVVDALVAVRDPRSSRRASALAADFRQRHPESLFASFIAMRAAILNSETDEARAMAEAILDAPLPPVGLEAAFRPRARSVAADALFDFEFARIEQATDAAERDAALVAAQAALERLRQERNVEQVDLETDSMMLKAEGRILFAAGRNAEALAKFEQIIRNQGTTTRDAESLYLSGVSAFRVGDYGLAESRLTQALLSQPRQPVFLTLRAQVRFARGDIQGSRADINIAKEVAPDAPFVRDTERMIIAAEGAATDAIRESQRRLQGGDIDGARGVLASLPPDQASDLRILRQRARVEAIAGDREAALEIVRAGLEIAPDDADLRQLLVIIETEDRGEAIVRAAEVTVTDDTTRPMAIYMAMRREAALLRMRGEDRARRGNEAGSAADIAEADRLEALALPYREAAAALDPPDLRYVSLVFDEALAGGDLDSARAILAEEQARTTPLLTPSALVRMEVRIMVAAAEVAGQTSPADRREMLARAAELAIEARDRSPESTELLLLAGELQGMLGNLEAAVENLGRAYLQRPTDPRVIEIYVQALQRSGARVRLLEVLRQVTTLTTASPAMIDAWLEAEAVYGSPREALLRRRARFTEAPGDSANGMRLVNLLLSLVPARELAIDPAGRDRFTEAAWRTMSQPQQREALETLRRQWLDEAGRVLDGVVVNPSNRFQVAGMRSELLRRRGDMAGGEQVLRAAIEASGDSVDAAMWLSLGNYLSNVGKAAEADVAFAEALQRQGPQREADRVLTDVRLAQGRVDDAIGHLRAVIAQNPDRIASLRLVELLQRSERLEEAEAALAEATRIHGTDSQSLMLQSLLLGRRAATATGPEATELRDRQRSLLRQAGDLASSDPAPLAAEAEVIVDIWIRGENPDPLDVRLNEAIVLLDRAIALRANYWPAVRMKALILARRGDVTRARADLEALLLVAPGVDDARAMLIELWESSRNYERAIQVAQEAIDRSPLDGRWLATLGELRSKTGDRSGAIAAHRRAIEVDPSRGAERLVMILMEADRNGRRDHAAVVQLVESTPRMAEQSPFIRAAYGASLVLAGQRDRGLEQLRQSHGQYRAGIAARIDNARALGGWYDQVQIAFGIGRISEVEAFARSFIDIDASAFDLHHLGASWSRSGPEGLSRGIELLTRAEELSRGMPPRVRSAVLFDFGVSLIAAERCEDAIRVYREGVELDAESPSILNNLAYLYVICIGDPKSGLPYVERALRMSPNVAEFHDTHGVILARLGQNTAAESALRTSLSIAPSHGTYVNLARLLVDTGRNADAREALSRAIELNPRLRDDPEYRALDARVGR